MNLLELAIKIFVDNDEANKELDKTENKAMSMTKKLGGGIATAAKVGAAAVTAAATAVGAVTTQAVKAYGEYEQLAGGIETLYKASSHQMMSYANQAYKTAGLSVNEYMETAIQSSAAMISSLGGDTAKAAKLTDMAIIDMADNVNKMGTTMESVQNAYRGFSRGNFTMLDNLALGFAGTKEGMQQLLDKAKEISGIEYNIDSYADIVQAIHVVQDEMGITGTTAKEGAETIQGSIATMKAAWENLITGFANPDADLGHLITQLIESAEKAFENLMPAIEHALEGVADFIEHIAPLIAEKLPGLIEKILPSLLSAGTTLVVALVEALPQFIPIIIEALPGIISQIWDAILQIVESQSPVLAGIFGSIGDAIAGAFGWIVENGEFLMELIKGIFTAFMAWKALGFVVSLIKGIIGVVQVLFGLIAANPVGAVIIAVTAAILIIKHLWETNEEFRNKVIAIWESIKQFFTSIGEFFKNLWTGLANKARTWGRDLMTNFINGIKEKWNNLKSTMSDMASTVKSYIGFSEPEEGPLSNFHTYAPDMMELFAQGIRDNERLISDQFSKSLDFANPVADVQAADVTTEAAEGGTASGDAWAQVISLLQIIANKELAVSPAGLLTIVRDQNDIYKKANGVGAL